MVGIPYVFEFNRRAAALQQRAASGTRKLTSGGYVARPWLLALEDAQTKVIRKVRLIQFDAIADSATRKITKLCWSRV